MRCLSRCRRCGVSANAEPARAEEGGVSLRAGAAHLRAVVCLVAAAVVVLALAGCGARGPAAINGAFQNEPIFGDLSARSAKKVAPATAQGLVPLDGTIGTTQTFTETAGTDARGGSAAAQALGSAG